MSTSTTMLRLWVASLMGVAGCPSAERRDEPPQAPGPIDLGGQPGPTPPVGVDPPPPVQPGPDLGPKPLPIPPKPMIPIVPRPLPIFPVVAVTKPGCVVHGTSAVVKGTAMYDLPKGGRVVATFSGALAQLTMSDIPETDRSARAHVKTADGPPAFRIEGFVDPAQVDLYTARDIPIVADHVALASQQRVTLVSASGETLTVEHTLQGGTGQVVRVTAPCDAFSFSVGNVPPAPDPVDARGWRMRQSSVALLDRPGGATVYTFQLREGGTLLFWGRDPRSGYLHVTGRSDVVIDGWVRSNVLEPLHPGELMTSYVPVPPAGLEVGISGETTILTATRDVPLRLKPEAEEPAVGTLEAGAQIYAFAFVDGWARVLPKTLALKPPDDASFWVQQTDIMP